MKRIDTKYATLLFSLAIHALLIFLWSGPKTYDAPMESMEKVAIKFLTPVERVEAAPVTPLSNPDQPSRAKPQEHKPVNRAHAPAPTQRRMPESPGDPGRQETVVNASPMIPEADNPATVSHEAVSRAPKMYNTNRLPEYLAVVRATVERNKEYPALAKRMGVEGSAVIRVTVSQTGYAQSIKVLTSSGNKHLDTAAVSAVQNSQPFQAPENFGLYDVTIDIPILYRID